MYLPAGYVKLEGGTVNRENYPRLVALADSYNLWTSDTTANPGLFGEGDGSTTMVLPNWTGRMEQFAVTAGSKVDAGLPNITGSVSFRGQANGLILGESGGIYVSPGVNSIGMASAQNIASVNIYLDASRSDPIYSASQTVQPPAINVFAIMRY